MTPGTYLRADLVRALDDVPFDADYLDALGQLGGVPEYLSDAEGDRIYETQRACFAFGVAVALVTPAMPCGSRRTIADAAMAALETAGISTDRG